LTYALNLNKDEITSIQIDYARINFKPEQLKLIKVITNLVCEQISIPELAMRSITWFALNEWQMKYNMSAAEIANFPISDKLKAFKEIFNFGKERLKCMLSYPKEQSEILIDIAFERAFKFYLGYLNRIHR
jgi:hypothetical protein